MSTSDMYISVDKAVPYLSRSYSMHKEVMQTTLNFYFTYKVKNIKQSPQDYHFYKVTVIKIVV